MSEATEEKKEIIPEVELPKENESQSNNNIENAKPPKIEEPQQPLKDEEINKTEELTENKDNKELLNDVISSEKKEEKEQEIKEEKKEEQLPSNVDKKKLN